MNNKISNQKKNPKTQHVEMTHQEYEDLVKSIIDMGYVRDWYPIEEYVLELAEDPVEHLEFILCVFRTPLSTFLFYNKHRSIGSEPCVGYGNVLHEV